jgi:hypothetical protein
MGDHALLHFMALAHRLDQTQVLVTTIAGFDRAKEHARPPATLHIPQLKPHIQ